MNKNGLILEVDRIDKQFDTVHAVNRISFSVARGEVLGVLGPNGAGKTTAIRMILGIFDPDSGEIRTDLDGRSGRVPKERTGYLPEERGLYDSARVLDLLVYFGELKGMPKAAARERATDWLDRFDLTDWKRSKVEKLSKGMQQKVQFIASVLHRPDLVVLDEPFSGLDPVNQDLLKEIVRGLRDDGAAVLLSSHQMNLVEELCDRIFLIHRGERVLYGGLDAIKEAHGEHAVRLRFRGEGGALAGLQGATEVDLEEGRASFRLTGGVTPDDFIREIPEDIEILALHVDRPPLHDIFVHTIEGDYEAR